MTGAAIKSRVMEILGWGDESTNVWVAEIQSLVIPWGIATGDPGQRQAFREADIVGSNLPPKPLKCG